MNRDIPIKLAS